MRITRVVAHFDNLLVITVFKITKLNQIFAFLKYTCIFLKGFYIFLVLISMIQIPLNLNKAIY